MESFKNYFVSFWKGLWSLLVGMKVTGTEFVTKKVTVSRKSGDVKSCRPVPGRTQTGI